ncbi:MAG: PorP/SprF family type IX secretion system membrane protein [Bacteroidales bacterium]
MTCGLKPYQAFLLIILLPSGSLVAQDAIFSQFFASPLYLNPAFAGAQHCSRLALNYRNQPFPEFGTFSAFNASYDQYSAALSGGVGILASSDHQGGLIMKNQIAAIYAYQLQLSGRWHLHFGAQAGYYRKDLNWSKLQFMDQWNYDTGEIDAQTETEPDETFRQSANFAAGVLFFDETYYFGFAAHHLTRPRESFFGDHRLAVKYTAHLGMTLYPGGAARNAAAQEGFFVSPNVIIQTQAGRIRINYGAYVGLDPLVAGAWLRQNLERPNALIFLLGITQGNYRVGYSYDYSLSGYSAGIQGAHEISISLNLNCDTKNMKYRILNCPSF